MFSMTRWLLEFSLNHSFSDKAFITFGIAKTVALAAFTWWLCGFSMWLWNRRFKMRMRHHVCCAFAALVTLLSIFTFQSVGGFKTYAAIAIQFWQEAYASDIPFHRATFVQTYDRLRDLYREKGWSWDSVDYPDPRDASNPGHALPRQPDRPEVQELVLNSYRDRTIEHLKIREPILSKILWKDTQIDLGPLEKDVDDFFNENHGGNYSFETGTIRLTRELAVQILNTKIERQIPMLRLKLVGLFFGAQVLAFSLAGYSAYSELKMSQN